MGNNLYCAPPASCTYVDTADLIAHNYTYGPDGSLIRAGGGNADSYGGGGNLHDFLGDNGNNELHIDGQQYNSGGGNSNSMKFNDGHLSQIMAQVEPFGSVFEDTLQVITKPPGQDGGNFGLIQSQLQQTLSKYSNNNQLQDSDKFNFMINPLDAQLLLFSGTNNVVLVRWLLLLGASPFTQDINGTTPLHAASRSGSRMIVRDLVARSRALIQQKQQSQNNTGTIIPLVNRQDHFGCTPLHIACLVARRGVIRDILERGGDVGIRNKRGKRPLDVAMDEKSKKIIVNHRLTLRKNVNNGMNSINGNTKPVTVNAVSMTQPQQVTVQPDNEEEENCSHHHNPEDNKNPDRIVKFEPFFVPRKPVIGDKTYKVELSRLGVHYFNLESGGGGGGSGGSGGPGRALAFLVSTHCVQDFPIALSIFLKRRHCHPDKIGSFLGESFSLAHVLRVEFLNSIRLSNTGVISSLRKLFTNLTVPPNLLKLDRILFDTALTWWRQVTKKGQKEGQGQGQGTQGTGSVSGAVSGITTPTTEPEGQKLMDQLESFEALHQLMFSVLFLHWNLHSMPQILDKTNGPSTNPFKPLSFDDFVSLNSGIEGLSSDMDTLGKDPPLPLLKILYNQIKRNSYTELSDHHAIGSSRTTENVENVLESVWGSDKVWLTPEIALSSKMDYRAILQIRELREEQLKKDFSTMLHVDFCDDDLKPISINNVVKIVTGNSLNSSDHVFLEDQRVVDSFFQSYLSQSINNSEMTVHEAGSSVGGQDHYAMSMESLSMSDNFQTVNGQQYNRNSTNSQYGPTNSSTMNNNSMYGSDNNYESIEGNNYNQYRNSNSSHYASLDSLMAESTGGGNLINGIGGTGNNYLVQLNQDSDNKDNDTSNANGPDPAPGTNAAAASRISVSGLTDLLLSGYEGLEDQGHGMILNQYQNNNNNYNNNMNKLNENSISKTYHSSDGPIAKVVASKNPVTNNNMNTQSMSESYSSYNLPPWASLDIVNRTGLNNLKQLIEKNKKIESTTRSQSQGSIVNSEIPTMESSTTPESSTTVAKMMIKPTTANTNFNLNSNPTTPSLSKLVSQLSHFIPNNILSQFDVLQSENTYLVLACGLILFHNSPKEPPYAFINLRDSANNRSLVANDIKEDPIYSNRRKKQLQQQQDQLRVAVALAESKRKKSMSNASVNSISNSNSTVPNGSGPNPMQSLMQVPNLQSEVHELVLYKSNSKLAQYRAALANLTNGGDNDGYLGGVGNGSNNSSGDKSNNSKNKDRVEVVLLFTDARWDFFHPQTIKLRFPDAQSLARWRCKINIILEQGSNSNVVF